MFFGRASRRRLALCVRLTMTARNMTPAGWAVVADHFHTRRDYTIIPECLRRCGSRDAEALQYFERLAGMLSRQAFGFQRGLFECGVLNRRLSVAYAVDVVVCFH